MSSRWPVRAALLLALAVLVAYSLFGIAAPLYWGHHGYNAAIYLMRARTSLRQHILVPCNWTGFDPPRPDALYLHHPIGYHHLLTLLIPIFGDHEWLARAVGLAGTLLVCGVLYTTVRRFWSREAGAVAVWIYVCLPMITSFSSFCDPMMPTFACIVWGVSAYLRLLQNEDPTRVRRLLVEAFFAYAICGLLMWEMYFIAPFIAVHAFCVRRRYPQQRLFAHVLVIFSACALMMAFHLWFTHHTGAWSDFIESYRVRKAPPSGSYVMDRHLQWLDILYGAPPMLLGFAWLTWFLVRCLLGRTRRRDLLPLTFLYVNTLYIWLFAEGSAVHLYRVFMFSGYFTLALTDLVVEVAHGARRLVPRPVALALAAIVLGGYFAFEVPHAWANLLESRVMMGTHGQPGYDPEREKMKFAQEVHRLVPPGARLIVHYRHLTARKELWYYLDRSFDEINNLSELVRIPKERAARSVLLIDEQMMDGGERAILRELLRTHPVTWFDHFGMVDLRSQTPGETSWAFYDLPTTAAYRFFVSHRWAPLGLKRKAYLPGLCESLAVGAPIAAARDELPPDPPKRPGLTACLHNAQVARGEDATASERAVIGALPLLHGALGSAQIVAAGREGGSVRLVLRASGPEAGELRYRVTVPPPRPLAPPLPGPAPPARPGALVPGKPTALPRGKQPPVGPVAPPAAPPVAPPAAPPIAPPVAVAPMQLTLPRGPSVPSPRDWRAGQLYVDTVPVQPGARSLAVELFDPTSPASARSRAELPH